jgi:hypothetical protein
MVEYRSKDEEIMASYLQTLQDHGYVDSFDYEPTFPQVAPNLTVNYKVPRVTKEDKIVTKELLSNTTYTPDFVIVWNKKAEGIFYKDIKNIEYNNKVYFYAEQLSKGDWEPFTSYIDVKPPAAADMCAARVFGLTQRFIYATLGIYVQKVVVRNSARALVHNTFVPEDYRVNAKTGHVYSFGKFKAPSFNMFLNSL